MAEVPLPSGGTQSAFLPGKIGQCKNGHGGDNEMPWSSANILTEFDIAHSHIVSRMVWSLRLAPSVWHRWDFDEQLHSTFPETAPWEPVASRTSIGWVGLVGLIREQSFTFDCGSIPGRNIVSNTLVFPCSSIWLCMGQQQVYHRSTFIARLHSGCIILTESNCIVAHLWHATRRQTIEPYIHNHTAMEASPLSTTGHSSETWEGRCRIWRAKELTKGMMLADLLFLQVRLFMWNIECQIILNTKALM